MKKIILIIMSLFVGMIVLSGQNPIIYAEESEHYESELSGEVDDVLSEYELDYSYFDMTALSLSDVLSKIRQEVYERIHAPIRLLGIILLMIVFSSFMKNMGEGLSGNSPSSDLYGFICVASASAAISQPLLELYRNTSKVMERGGGFMTAFVPIYVGIIIISGGPISAELYNGISLIAAELMVQAADKLVMPLLSMLAALAIMGSIFPNSFIDSLSALIKKLVTWGMTLCTTLFAGFVSIKSTLGAKVDGFAVKSVKFVMSGFIPVVGSAVSDAYSTVKGSFDIMKCTVGAAGTIGIALIFLPPVIELIAYRVVMWMGIAAAEMFSASPLAKLMKGIDNGLAIATSLLICFGLFFIISTAILMKASG